MMPAILFSLESIGYILSAALCIAVLLICAVLFAPLKYKGKAYVENTADSADLNLNFSWILHLISGHVSFRDKKAEWSVRIAWKCLPQERKEKKETKVKQKPRSEKIPSTAKKTDEKRKAEGKKEAASKKKKTLKEKTEEKIRQIYDTMRSLKDRAWEVSAFLKDDVHQAAFSKLLKEAKIFLFHIKPKKLTGYVRYGFEDPSATGKTFGLISVLYPFLGGDIEVVPCFNDKRIEADLELAGDLRAIYAPVLILKLIADKNIRVTIKHIKKLVKSR